MMPPERVDAIRERLQHAFSPTRLSVTDDSHRHAGHAGAQAGGGHFQVDIESTAFEGKKLLERHRMVYAALDDMMQHDIHALSVRARAPDEP